jgi:primosomal protein N' (replication factor Y)
VQGLFNSPETTSEATLFCDVLIPVPIPGSFTYRVPKEYSDKVTEGSRVVVQFGKRKILTGIVKLVHQTAPEAYEARYILEVLDDQPIVQPVQLKLFDWMAKYYMCTPGEVMNVAVPSGLKLSSQSRVQLHPNFSLESSEESFNEKEALLIRTLEEQDSLTYAEVEELMGQKSLYQLFKNLIAKEAILLFEEVKEKYKPKTLRKVRLAPGLVNERDDLEALFRVLEATPKQLQVLQKYLQLVPVLKNPEKNSSGILKSQLVDQDVSPSSVRTLIKNGVLEQFEETVARFDLSDAQTDVQIKLTTEQQQVKAEILNHFESKDTVLLHGITGSGKTELYISLIEDALAQGDEVLLLLPEIALTTQIVNRLKRVFGSQMGVYHSRFSDNERVEVWQGVLSGSFPLVVGVRSSVFLPFKHLGLIIIDEEHEASYKQYDPAPRYYARDTALVLAQLHHAKTLLGSATPSVESYYHAQQNKYGLVKMMHRYGTAQLPKIQLADTRVAKRDKVMKAMFTPELTQSLQSVLEKKQQAIIFQNRRGYAPYLTCEECNWIPKCENCAVSLTYHMYSNELKCHYCGFQAYVPTACPACGSSKVHTVGHGTEKLEESIRLIMPGAEVRRMDLDTTRRKNSYQELLNEFEERKVDVLVGTQMVSKGLDFEGVTLVGIFDADRMIHYPDYRSYERAYQMLTQVAGRAGRSKEAGKVIIQTANVEQPILHKVIVGDYEAFYTEEIRERERYNYPPFSRLVRLTVRHKEKAVAEQAAAALTKQLAAKLDAQRVLGPEEPLIGRIRGLYLFNITIKLERLGLDVPAIKAYLQQAVESLLKVKEYKKASVIADVDPV